MRRLPQRLLSLWLTGILLLHLCQGNVEEYDYDYNTTATPDYDYNVTFEYDYVDSTVNYESYEILKSTTKDEKGNMAPETGLPGLLLIMSLSIHKLCWL
ncbi:hypothetical protein COCON_G00006340 [Conger conger]|uniref:Uncharacterized protein n=1 Tax=Conger conger TaxID=82655 RepID=A0A9Q1E1N1_CONCO|nr:hypothetical protein COCON_G00006340 [Conger conger]